MFKMFESLTKSVLGFVFSPVAVAADVITCGGIASDRDEPYTVTAMRNVLQNMENAFDPEGLSDDQIRQIIKEVEKQRSR